MEVATIGFVNQNQITSPISQFPLKFTAIAILEGEDSTKPFILNVFLISLFIVIICFNISRPLLQKEYQNLCLPQTALQGSRNVFSYQVGQLKTSSRTKGSQLFFISNTIFLLRLN